MESLPVEINTNILLRLPIKTLCLCKCVSKTFKTQITTHHFTTSHRDSTSYDRRYRLLIAASSLHTLNIFNNDHQLSPPLLLPFEPPSISAASHRFAAVVGSCNGLICLFYSPNTFALLNPTTREFRVLPDPGTCPDDVQIRLSGFGYVSSCDDYMIVNIATDNTGVGDSVIRVYSAKANTWKTVCIRVPFRVQPWVKPVYVNGVVHWLGFGGKFPPVQKIMGFDFADEGFKILPLPPNIKPNGIVALGVLDGCVCFLSREPGNDIFLEMWVMMDYGVGESWIKTFKIACPSNGITYIFPICNVEDKVLLQVHRKRLVLYDPVKQSKMHIEIMLGERKGTWDAVVYEESLVSPYGHICEDEGQGM